MFWPLSVWQKRKGRPAEASWTHLGAFSPMSAALLRTVIVILLHRQRTPLNSKFKIKTQN